MEKATTKVANTDPNYYEVSNEFDNEGLIQQQGQFEMEVTDQQSSQKRKKWSIIIPVIVVVSLQLLTLLVIIILFATSSCNCSQESHGSYTGGNTSQNDITELKQIVSSIAETACVADGYDQSSNSSNETSPLQQVNNQLDHIVSTLSNMKQTGISTAGVADDILGIVEELLQLQNASSILNSVTPVSCQDIKAALPNSPSGYYHVNSRDIYCNMGELCGSGGGWTRLAYLDMSDSTQNCPTGLRLYQSGGVRACGSPSMGAGCASIQFPSNGISYSQVCGRVVGYQWASPDAVYPGRYSGETYGTVIDASHNNINSYYVDGISITRGSPRQHVWTLMGGLNEASFYHVFNDGRYNCPCSAGSLQGSTLQSFIGNDYFCESGNPSTNGHFQGVLYTSDPLWDGQGCGSLEVNCCTAPGLPWFNKNLNTTTSDYLEMRFCQDENTNNEDTPAGLYEIYVK